MIRPICIFKPGEVDVDSATELADLLTDDILGRKIVVISIAGRFRQGKSFIMNFIIRYLRAGGAPDWLEKDAPDTLEGFDWRHTRKRVTLGVLIWPEVFKLKSASGEEVVVILMDTQGIFDTNTTVKDCTSIFSLSVLLSSVQMFNIKQNIQGDDLSHLELFTEFGRLICVDSSDMVPGVNQKPFQDLIFLVRDWAYPEESPYGWDGGRHVLEEELQNAGFEGELASMRTSIKNCFESLRCFLMPHPGKKVDTSSDFRGNVADIEPVFVDHLKSFTEDVFRPDRLRPKKVHGNELTVRDFLVFVELYVREMHSGRFPTPKTLFDATVNATNSAVVNSCLEKYQQRVSTQVETDPQTPEKFEKLHECIIAEIFAQFNDSAKMGGDGVIAVARADLSARIDSLKQHFKRANSSAYERKLFQARVDALLEEQRRLKEEIDELGDATGELEYKLNIAEDERSMIQRLTEKKLMDMREAMEAARATAGPCRIF